MEKTRFLSKRHRGSARCHWQPSVSPRCKRLEEEGFAARAILSSDFFFNTACAVLLVLGFCAAPPANSAAAEAGQPEASDSEAAVREAAWRFRSAVHEGSYKALLPMVTASDGRAIQERLNLKLPIFRVSDLQGFFAEAISRSHRGAAQPDPDAEPEFSVTLSDAGHARLDVEPLLSFRHSVYLVQEEGAWKIDLTMTLRRSREPRPKEEIISICRLALRGIAEDADLLETKHFLIFAHTGPLPAQQTAQLLEELYENIQPVFPFDLGISPSANSPSPGVGNPASAETANMSLPAAPGLPAAVAETAALPYSPGPDPYMIVFLFSYHQTYLQFAERHDPGGALAGGYATPPGYFAVWFSPMLRPTVRHEGTHLLMFRQMHLFGVPSWLSEGMAETMADPREAYYSETPLRELMRKVTPLSLEPLLMKDKIAFGTDYALSQSLVHYLRAEHPKEWVELFAFIRKSSRPQPKECHAELLRLLGMTQSQLDEAWRNSVLEAKPGGGE